MPSFLRAAAAALLCACALTGESDAAREYRRRVDTVRSMPGFVALWDFVLRESGPGGRFDAHQPKGARRDFALDAVNYVRDYWSQGRPATYDDFPLLGRGPFGQAVHFRQEPDPAFRPCLLVPRDRLHNSGLDVKGPKRSVSMVVWMIRSSGNHAIAGIWHEGTDLQSASAPVTRVERGKRQYALFAGLAANNGASAVHVSENGARSFGDRYARNLAATPQLIPTVPIDAPGPTLDAAWSAVGFVFDNAKNTVTAYLNGEAADYWIENPERHPFFQWPYKGWVQAQLQDPAFPRDQYYQPPEGKPLERTLIEKRDGERVELHRYAFTKVRVTLGRDARGKYRQVRKRELVALRANPFWFGHDLYAPATPADGGPFTIGRVIHTSRGTGISGYIGGVAIFAKPLTPAQMRRLATIGRPVLLSAATLQD